MFPDVDICQQSSISNVSGGVIRSPGYPGNYPNNENCVLVINADPGYTINLTITDFQMKTWDWLDVHDGTEVTDSNQLAW